MKFVYAVFFLIIIGFSADAQEIIQKNKEQVADFTLGFSNAQTTIAATYYQNWNLGKKQKFFIGTGIRFSNALGKSNIFTSAPASLASNDANIDSLFGANTSIYAVNAIINMGYHISPKLNLGFNIDLIGFSFGPSSKPLFKSNGLQTLTSAKPTGMNILLVGNNDRGTLNSEFYLRYKVNKRLGIKVAVQHFFTELTTTNKVQSMPVQNDRFRNITDLFGLGIAYQF